MRDFIAALVVVMAVSMVGAGAMAQSKATPQPPPMTKGDKPMSHDKPMAQTLEGKIKSVTPNGLVTLEDGTKLMIPKTVMVPKDQLKPGATIVAEYEQKGGQKVATSVHIKS